MLYEMKPLSINDGHDVYDLLQTILTDENGFMNGMYGADYDTYRTWLVKSDEMARGIGLEDWQVAQTSYWLYCDGQPVAYGKLRHSLTDRLRREGGHMGYAVRTDQRGKGHATELVRRMLKEAAKLGIESVLLTIHDDNPASARVAEKCGGTLEKRENGRLYYWLSTEA